MDVTVVKRNKARSGKKPYQYPTFHTYQKKQQFFELDGLREEILCCTDTFYRRYPPLSFAADRHD